MEINKNIVNVQLAKKINWQGPTLFYWAETPSGIRLAYQQKGQPYYCLFGELQSVVAQISILCAAPIATEMLLIYPVGTELSYDKKHEVWICLNPDFRGRICEGKAEYPADACAEFFLDAKYR